METYTCAKCNSKFAIKAEGIRNTCFDCDMPYCEECMCQDKGMCYDCIDDESDYDDDESEEEDDAE
jgi:hypothetical protein